MVVTDSETVLPPVLLSHVLLIHNFLSLGGIPRTFWEQHKSVQSIPTDSFPVGYGACEKPNDFPEFPKATGTRARDSAPRMSHTYHLAVGGYGAWAALPASWGRGGNPTSSEVSADCEGGARSRARTPAPGSGFRPSSAFLPTGRRAGRGKGRHQATVGGVTWLLPATETRGAAEAPSTKSSESCAQWWTPRSCRGWSAVDAVPGRSRRCCCCCCRCCWWCPALAQPLARRSTRPPTW